MLQLIPSHEYAFIDLDNETREIAGFILTDKGEWAGTTSYAQNNVVAYQTSLYIALRSVSGYPPSSVVDENWSSLVDLTDLGQFNVTCEEIYYIALAAGSLAQLAYDAATSGTWLEDGTHVIHEWHVDWGTNPGQINAVHVPYTGPYPTVGAALDALFYVAPAVTSFTNNVGVVEKGSTVSSVRLDWAYNVAIVSQSISQGIGSLAVALRTYTQTGTYTTDRTYALTASDGGNTATGSTTVYFRQKRYWGTNSSTTLTDGQILALSSEFSTGRAQTRTITSSAEYVYFAYPAAWGAATFTVNGLLNTAWTLVTRAFVNASGYSESYDIYRSNNLLTGTYIITIS